MKLTAILCPSLILLFCSTATSTAAPTFGGMSGEAAVMSDGLSRWSAGISFENFEREIKSSGLEDSTIRGGTALALLGFDVTPWLTLHAGGTLSEIDSLRNVSGLDDRRSVQGSIGAQASLWQLEVANPDYLSGQLSLGVSVSYAEYEAENDSATASWDNLVVAVPLQLRTGYSDKELGTIQSAGFYAGPVFSELSGDLDAAGLKSRFDQSEDLGALAGVDVFLHANLLVGVQVQYFERYSYSGSIRWHF